MSIQKAGIESIHLGLHGGSNNNTSKHKIRKGASLIISSLNEAKDYLERTYKNMMLFKAEVNSMHINYDGISLALSILLGSADVSLKTDSGIFNFNDIKLDVELDFNEKEKTIKYMMEKGMGYADGLAAITLAATDTGTYTDDLTYPALYDLGHLETIYLCNSSGAKGNAIISKDYFDTYKLTIKSKSVKTGYNYINPYALTFGFEIASINNDITTMASLAGIDYLTNGLYLEFYNGTATTEFIFKPGAFNPLPEFEISDTNRMAKLKYSGGVAINTTAITFNNQNKSIIFTA